MKTVTKALLVAALGLVLSGLVIGFALPVHDDYDYKCGSAFHESKSAHVDQLTDTLGGGSGASNCSAWRNQALQIPVALLLLGVTGLVMTMVVNQPSLRSAPDVPESGPQSA